VARRLKKISQNPSITVPWRRAVWK